MTPESVRDAFAEIFAEMDASARPLAMKVLFRFEIDLESGEPVFRAGGAAARGRFRRRWLAEHPVPARIRPGDVLRFLPASGNRVKVRKAGFFEKLALCAGAVLKGERHVLERTAS